MRIRPEVKSPAFFISPKNHPFCINQKANQLLNKPKPFTNSSIKMPELPEVNTFQVYFNQHALHQEIQKVSVADAKIIRNVSGATFKKRLTGRTFTGSYRRGKYLFANLDNGHHLLLHFGMTGDLAYYHDPQDRPKHERFAFTFADGAHLGFDCPRKFARILYLDDLEEYLRETQLGEDAQRIEEADFLAKMKGRKVSIKGFLLNQKLLAGVGNLYADEICYQCRIHPASSVAALPLRKRKQVFAKMKNILQTAVERKAHYKAYPENWFWEWRKEGAFGPGGHPVVHSTVAGRSTYHVENFQKIYEQEVG